MATGHPHYTSVNSALRDTGRRSVSGLLGSTVGALRQAFSRPAPRPRAEAVQSPSGFAISGDRMLREARRLRQPLSMLVFDFEDLPEARENLDRPAFQALLAAVLARLADVAGARGIVGHTGPAEFSILLPACTRDEAQAQLTQCMGTPARVEHRAGRRGDILLLPHVEIEQAGPDIEHIMELHGELRYDLDEASSCQRQYLQRLERGVQSSRPMSLEPFPPTLAAPLAPSADATAPSTPRRSPGAAR